MAIFEIGISTLSESSGIELRLSTSEKKRRFALKPPILTLSSFSLPWT